jgi:hypothetical protein
MNSEQAEQLEFIRGLSKILIESKLECLEAFGVKLAKSKHMDPKTVRIRGQQVEEQPTDDEIMSFVLDEPMPDTDAIKAALSASSEPKRSRRVRKEVV